MREVPAPGPTVHGYARWFGSGVKMREGMWSHKPCRSLHPIASALSVRSTASPGGSELTGRIFSFLRSLPPTSLIPRSQPFQGSTLVSAPKTEGRLTPIECVCKACLTLGIHQRPNEMTEILGECCLQQIQFPQELPVTEAPRLPLGAREKKV